MKLGTIVCLKRLIDRSEFELGLTRIKNNIAENSVALGHETHNRLILINTAVKCFCYEMCRK